MQKIFHFSLPSLLLGLMLVGSFPAMAEKPEWAGKAGGGKPEKHGKHEKDHRDDVRSAPRPTSSGVSVNIQIGGYFGDSQRVAVREYYEPQFRAGNCPPGLAKKNNGCMPPGQAKKWRVGRPLPGDVVYYPVPSGVSVQIGLPPAGHKYVRVAADILLIAVGTGMVVDAIEDLGRL
jgi:Ni/Co efflux regulator RcnB